MMDRTLHKLFYKYSSTSTLTIILNESTMFLILYSNTVRDFPCIQKMSEEHNYQKCTVF